MKRLTFDGNFCDISQCAAVRDGSFCEDGACSQRKTWERLKAYEDTGLTPERCAELAEADRDGRLVVLPCKVCVHIWINGREAVILKFFGFKNERYFEAQFFDTRQYIALAFDEIGKTVFLTREEAEQALKEAKVDG